MKITPSKINTLLTIGENLNIEFKRAGDGPKTDTFESVCAFLNKAGGDLLLGVDDDGTVVGLPPKSVDAMIRYGRITPKNLEPEPKNPIIANFFHQIQLADELGSGVRNLYKYVRIYSGALPIFDEGDIFRLTVPLNAEHSPEGGNDPRTENPDRKPKIELVEQLLQLIQTTPKITQNEMVRLLGIARSTLNVHIDALKKSGRLRRVGPDKGGHWEVIG